MKRNVLQALLLCIVLVHFPSMARGRDEFSFGVISHPISAAADEAALREAIDETDAENLAFVVANGMKAAHEPCTDVIYSQRKALLENAKHGLIVSLAASDWAVCRNENGKSAAIGKLNRLRELFFSDEFSLGASKIPVMRQSMTVKHRSFVENARWEIGGILFATANIPANNNHYVSDAGRNSEFEDRLVANHDWLYRIFTSATRKKLAGIVLFSDGNPLATNGLRGGKRDGYAELRKHITTLTANYPGKVLLVYGAPAKTAMSPEIRWRNGLGELGAGSGWIKINVTPSDPALFKIVDKQVKTTDTHQ